MHMSQQPQQHAMGFVPRSTEVAPPAWAMPAMPPNMVMCAPPPAPRLPVARRHTEWYAPQYGMMHPHAGMMPCAGPWHHPQPAMPVASMPPPMYGYGPYGVMDAPPAAAPAPAPTQAPWAYYPVPAAAPPQIHAVPGHTPHVPAPMPAAPSVPVMAPHAPAYGAEVVANPVPWGTAHEEVAAEPPAEGNRSGGPAPPPARTVEGSAVPLAAFAAEAMWGASADLLSMRRLRPYSRSESRLDASAEVGSAQSATPETPSQTIAARRSPVASAVATGDGSSSVELRAARQKSPVSPTARSSESSASATSTSEPCTPSAALTKLASPSLSPCSARAGKATTLDACLGSLQLDEEHAERSAALHSLVRAISASDRAKAAFPSLDSCGAALVREEAARAAPGHRSSSGSRRTSPSPFGRDRSPLLGEATPAFRRFVHQVLSQTLLSPTALVLALYYMRELPRILAAPGEAGGDEAGALALFAHPPSTAPFKLLTLGLMLANKHLDDNTFLNKTWHEVTGIPLGELNRMETFYLCRAQYQLMVDPATWQKHVEALREQQTQGSGHSEERERLCYALDEMLAALS